MNRSLELTKRALVGVSCALALASQVVAQQPSDTITVFIARKIVTMNPSQPTATAVAVRGREIVGVGTLENLQPWLKLHPHRIGGRSRTRC